MIVIDPYGLHALTDARPDLADVSIAAKVTEASAANA